MFFTTCEITPYKTLEMLLEFELSPSHENTAISISHKIAYLMQMSLIYAMQFIIEIGIVWLEEYPMSGG